MIDIMKRSPEVVTDRSPRDGDVVLILAKAAS
jgi:hypothetical protein